MMRHPVTIETALVQRWQAIEVAALALIDAIDENLARKPWPFKYGVPFGAALDLRNALRAPPLGPPPNDKTPMGRIPPGPRDA